MPTRLGEILTGQERFEQATQAFTRALELDASHLPAQVGLAQLHATGVGTEDKAQKQLEFLRTILARNPRCGEALALLATNEVINGRDQPALDALDELLRWQPSRLLFGKKGQPFVLLGPAWRCNSPAAIDQVKISGRPNSPIWHYLRGRWCWLQGQREEARGHLQKAEQTDPSLAARIRKHTLAPEERSDPKRKPGG